MEHRRPALISGVPQVTGTYTHQNAYRGYRVNRQTAGIANSHVSVPHRRPALPRRRPLPEVFTVDIFRFTASSLTG
jgi:hypothetical protein